jgi:hypothetical protein
LCWGKSESSVFFSYFFSRAGSRSSYTRPTRRPTYCSEELAEGAGRPAERKASGRRACDRPTRSPQPTPCRPRAPARGRIEYSTGYNALKRCSKGGSIAAHVVSIPIESEHARHVARRVGASPPRHLREHCTRDRQILATHAIVTDEGGHQGAIRGHQGPSEVIRGSRTLRCCTT